MGNEALLAEAKQAIVDYEKDRAEEIARQALTAGIAPSRVMMEGFVPGITKAGDLFEQGQLFLPELMLAAEAMKAASAICMAALPKSEVKATNKIVIGTVEGDNHDIGKSIVVSFLLANGFEVYDIGRDVPVADFVKKVQEVGADVVGGSALLTTTMQN